MHIFRMEPVCIRSFHHRVQDLISFYVWVKLLLFLPTTQAASGLLVLSTKSTSNMQKLATNYERERVELSFTQGREELRKQEGRLKQNWLLDPCRRSRQAGSSPAVSIALIISPLWPHFCQLCCDLCSFLFYSQMPAPALVWPHSGSGSARSQASPRRGLVARTWSCCSDTRRCPCKNKIYWF